MISYARNMREVATYWAPTGADEFGQVTFATPVEVRVRWERLAVLFRTGDGVETSSTAVVYCTTPLALEGQLLLGTSAGADPTALPGTFEIRQVAESPDLKQARQLTKVYL